MGPSGSLPHQLPLFLALYNDKTKWELTGYWHPLRRLGRDMGECYTTAYARWSAVVANASDPYVPSRLGQFLSVNGLYPPAEALLTRALAARERVFGPEHSETLMSVNNLAALLAMKGDYAGAQPLYERALVGLLKISARVRRPHPDLQTFIGNYKVCLERLAASFQNSSPFCAFNASNMN